MTFGEKLLRLRKEKNLSQEALAEQLNTTRQAVSKWENGQNYPETEKLLMISNLFNVSVDSLLKENSEAHETDGNGYYVGRECAEEYLAFEKKVTYRTSLGISFLIGAGIPYFVPRFNPAGVHNSPLFAAIILILGIGILVTVVFMENPDANIGSKILILDSAFHTELKSEYTKQKNKFITLIISGVVLLVTGIFLYKYLEKSNGLIFPYRELCCILFAAALYCFLFVVGIVESYDTLLDSTKRMNRLSIHIWKKMKDKLMK